MIQKLQKIKKRLRNIHDKDSRKLKNFMIDFETVPYIKTERIIIIINIISYIVKHIYLSISQQLTVVS